MTEQRIAPADVAARVADEKREWLTRYRTLLLAGGLTKKEAAELTGLAARLDIDPRWFGVHAAAFRHAAELDAKAQRLAPVAAENQARHQAIGRNKTEAAEKMKAIREEYEGKHVRLMAAADESHQAQTQIRHTLPLQRDMLVAAFPSIFADPAAPLPPPADPFRVGLPESILTEIERAGLGKRPAEPR